MLTIEPPPPSFMAAAAIWLQKKTALRLVSRIQSQSSSVVEAESTWRLRPALLTKASRPPHSRTA